MECGNSFVATSKNSVCGITIYGKIYASDIHNNNLLKIIKTDTTIILITKHGSVEVSTFKNINPNSGGVDDIYLTSKFISFVQKLPFEITYKIGYKLLFKVIEELLNITFDPTHPHTIHCKELESSKRDNIISKPTIYKKPRPKKSGKRDYQFKL